MPAVPLSVPVLAVVGAGVPAGAVRVVGLAAHLVPLLFAGVVAVLGKQVPGAATVPDKGPVAGGAAVPLTVAVPGDLGDVLVPTDVVVALGRAAVPGRDEVRVSVVSGFALVVAGLASGVDLGSLEVAAGAARSAVPA